MRILDWNVLDRPGRRDALRRPDFHLDREVQRLVGEVIGRVKAEGDAAVREFTKRFDRVWLESLPVTEAEFRAARAALTDGQIKALERSIANVELYHQHQRSKPFTIETEIGVRCQEITRPIRAVGLYVPAGSAPLPSTVIMLGVPARLAECPIRLLCTPPRAGGVADAAVLTAARLVGIEQVFKVGGAQAVAALAYGTESIPKADKIFGPGNAWVTAAKAAVSMDSDGAACDLPAGPTEVMVIADHTAREDFVAADLLAQAEHDGHAQAILVTDSGPFAQGVARQLDAQRRNLRRAAILDESLQSCRAIVVPDLDTAFEIANRYAPEHLMLHIREAKHWLGHVETAGAVFLGPWAAEAFGDYCSGTNHVLPTFGAARHASGLSVRDFLRTMSVQELTPEGLSRLGPTAITLARLEGLDGHANAVARRLGALDKEFANADRDAGTAAVSGKARKVGS